jgi:hypothetical protein
MSKRAVLTVSGVIAADIREQIVSGSAPGPTNWNLREASMLTFSTTSRRE